MVPGRNGDLRLVGEGSPGDDVGMWPYNTLGAKKPTPPTPRDIPVSTQLEYTPIYTKSILQSKENLNLNPMHNLWSFTHCTGRLNLKKIIL